MKMGLAVSSSPLFFVFSLLMLSLLIPFLFSFTPQYYFVHVTRFIKKDIKT